jgi:hypothetical protein
MGKGKEIFALLACCDALVGIFFTGVSVERIGPFYSDQEVHGVVYRFYYVILISEKKIRVICDLYIKKFSGLVGHRYARRIKQR